MASSSWVALSAPAGANGNGNPTASASSAAVHAYLEKLPGPTLARLYGNPSSALAILRLLPLSSRHIIMNLLWIDVPLSLADFEVWFSRRSEGRRQLEAAIHAMKRLHILQDVGKDKLHLNGNFQRSFKRALIGGGSHNSFGVPVDPSLLNPSIDIPHLDSYANTSWETILHYLVGSSIPTTPTLQVLNMLKATGLMSGQLQGRHGLKITSKGFQFLLEDVNSQLWSILLFYLRDKEEDENEDVVEVLGGLFMLGSLELGRAYKMENLSQAQRRMLNDFKDYGMVYFTKDTSYFYPTRLATTLTSNAPPLVTASSSPSAGPAAANGVAATSQEQGYIVLETNYRVYAYSSNPLQIAVLNLFVTLKSRFPNLVIGQITRESIKAALSNGIAAEQIITYLSTHAHPQLRKQTPLLPPTVVDQIRLWELEKNRITSEEGYLYEDFRTQSDFELVYNYAKQLECVRWFDTVNRKFLVSMDGHVVLRDFIKRRMAAAQAQA